MVTLFMTINKPSEIYCANNALSQSSAEVCSTETNWTSREDEELCSFPPHTLKMILYPIFHEDFSNIRKIVSTRALARLDIVQFDKCHCVYPVWQTTPGHILSFSDLLSIHSSCNYPSIHPTTVTETQLASEPQIADPNFHTAPHKWLLFWDQQTAGRAD